MANTKITSRVIADNAVGIPALAVSDGSDGQVLITNGSGTLSFATVSGTTINNNADNRIITGSGTANTLEGEANFVFDGSNVGIGTSSPNSYSGYTGLTLNGTTGSLVDLEVNGTVTGELYSDVNNGVGIQAVGSRHIQFKTNNVERMRIDSAGNVGIGATTVDAKLHIEVSSGDANLKLEDGSATYMLLDQNSIGGSDIIRFKTGSNLDERMRIDSSGVVHAKEGLGVAPITSCSGFTGTAGYKYLIQPVGAMEPFWAVYSGDNYKSRSKGYFRWWYGYGDAATGTNQNKIEVDYIDKDLEFHEVIVEDMAGTTYNSSAPAYEYAYWSTKQKFNTQSSNTNYATSSSMSGNIEALWGSAGGHGLYSSVIGNACSWGVLNANDVIGSGYTGSCGTYPTTLRGSPDPHLHGSDLRLGRPITGSASFTQSTGAFSYWFNF